MTGTIKAQPSDAGCWIDGHWGVYAITNLIVIAENEGFPVNATLESAIKCHDGRDCDEYTNQPFGCICSEIVNDAADDAEIWLNDNIAPEGFSFGWHDGEFFLWSYESWQKADW